MAAFNRSCRRISALLMLTGLVLLSCPAGSAAADEYAIGPVRGGWKPDNIDHYWCFGSSMAGKDLVKASYRKALDNMVAQTKMREFRDDGCGPTQTDVIFQERDLSGARGAYYCDNMADPYPDRCARAIVVMDINQIIIEASPGDVEKNRDKTACHELGHSLGFTHHLPEYDGCMVRGNITYGHQQYNDDHRNHINGVDFS